jgi:hypothetical protein
VFRTELPALIAGITSWPARAGRHRSPIALIAGIALIAIGNLLRGL